MALGTITVVKAFEADGPVRLDLLSFAADGAYPTGGTTAFQAKVRDALDRGNVEVLAVIAQDCAGFNPVYDKTNDKLKVYAANNTQVANTTDLSANTFNVMVVSV
jgi:hypothetical protein